jgi:hypothetical protein
MHTAASGNESGRAPRTPRTQDTPSTPAQAQANAPTTAERLTAERASPPTRLEALRDEPTTAQRLAGEAAPAPSAVPTDPATRAPLAAGVFQDLTYRVPNTFRDANGGPARFDLSFRDRSGFPNPTSHAYLNRTSPAPGNSWKGLRLDHGPNPTIGGASNWHWNHRGAGGFGIPDHTAASHFESGFGRTMQAAKPLGRVAVVAGAVMDGHSLATQINISRQTGDWSNTVQEGSRIAGGWTGAVVGAKAGGSLGAAIGTFIAPGIGTMVGGAVGGLIGGAAGYLAGSGVGSKIAGWFS